MTSPRKGTRPDSACTSRRAIASALLLFSLAACGEPASPRRQIALEQVQPPADLPRLDTVVRAQFEALWRELEAPSQGDRSAAAPSEPAAHAEAWGAVGQWFDVYKYPVSAARCYRNAHAFDSKEPRWPYHLGRLAVDAGDLEDAQRYFTTAARLAPETTAPRMRLGDLALERRDFEQARLHYDEVLARHPDDPGALLGSGRLALLEGNGQSALAYLEALSVEQGEASEVQYALGLAWRLLGDEAKAAEHFAAVPEDNFDQRRLALDDPWQHELQLLDRGAQMLTRRGIRAFRRGDHEQAARLLASAVIADPESADTRINYALALEATGGRAGAALEQLEAALHWVSPGSQLEAKAHVELGRLLAGIRPAEATGHLEAALAIQPDSVTAHSELGQLERLRGHPERALPHYAAVRADDRPRPGASFWYAALLSSLGRHAEARAALEADLERIGDDRKLCLLLARLLAAAPDPRQRDAEHAADLLLLSRIGTATEGPVIDGPIIDGPVIDVLHAETAAMVAAASGRFHEAIAWQEAAVATLETLPHRRISHPARRRLELYHGNEASSTPWEGSERLVTRPVQPPKAEGRE